MKKFFPYPIFRPFQEKAIKFAFDVIKNGKIGLLSSPCGTGKSVSVLTAFFMARDVDDSVGRLLALTRTRNQLEIYCRELKKIKEHSNLNFVASVFKSKREMCPRIGENAKLKEISYRDFLYYCKNLKEGAFGDGCKYYERTYNGWKPSWPAINTVEEIKKLGPLLPDEVYETCRHKALCPYEITKVLAKHADIVVGNYNYILVDSVRKSVLGRAGMRLKEVNCIFDEAHSLPYSAAGILSDEVSTISVRRALKEVESFGAEDFGLLESLYSAMSRLGKTTFEKFGLDVEHVIGNQEIVNLLLKRLDIKADRLAEIVFNLSEEGELIRRRRAELGKAPVSYLSRCADFLQDWISIEGSGYAHYVKVSVGRDAKKHVSIGVKCLDPSLAASITNKLRSAILMSGTLWHTNYYIDVLGIDKRRCKNVELPSPFPSENRLIIVDKSVTTKFERRGEEQWRKIADHLQKMIERIHGRIAVYFPSYEVMKEVLKAANFDLPFVVEERATRIVDVLNFLESNKQCIIFGVARGKISEGVDMSTEGRTMLSAVIIVGLPYPKRTELQNALLEYFKEKFGKRAIEYANDIPCLNALAQSAGRLLRSPEDRGIIVIMDGRAAGKFKHKLPREWREEIKSYLKVEKILNKIQDFYGERLD